MTNNTIRDRVQQIPDYIIQDLVEWLGDPGQRFFKQLDQSYGTLNVVWSEGSIPHATHFHEGMQVRNFLRQYPEVTNTMDDHLLDDCWELIVYRALDLPEQQINNNETNNRRNNRWQQLLHQINLKIKSLRNNNQ